LKQNDLVDVDVHELQTLAAHDEQIVRLAVLIDIVSYGTVESHLVLQSGGARSVLPNPKHLTLVVGEGPAMPNGGTADGGQKAEGEENTPRP
jgi:energy-converting hydrogenase A subunit M